MRDPRVFYLFLAGLVFWLGLWLTLGWLLWQTRRWTQRLETLLTSAPPDGGRHGETTKRT
ncbi:MAG: hypothetical protein NZ742_03000 [Acidobacteria bacterium]|nr:hypothetical protein [Acidobacteriota bacterium]MDW7984378.1 hypothetical protein [Acidobacteriota bacterium]